MFVEKKYGAYSSGLPLTRLSLTACTARQQTRQNSTLGERAADIWLALSSLYLKGWTDAASSGVVA